MLHFRLRSLLNSFTSGSDHFPHPCAAHSRYNAFWECYNTSGEYFLHAFFWSTDLFVSLHELGRPDGAILSRLWADAPTAIWSSFGHVFAWFQPSVNALNGRTYNARRPSVSGAKPRGERAHAFRAKSAYLHGGSEYYAVLFPPQANIFHYNVNARDGGLLQNLAIWRSKCFCACCECTDLW